MKSKDPFLPYVITFLIGIMFGTGGLWQFLNYGLEKEKLQFEKQIEAIHIRSQLNETVNKIVTLNKEVLSLQAESSNSEIIRNEYEIQYNYLIDIIEMAEICLAAIEGRNEKHYKLPAPVLLISPRAPKLTLTPVPDKSSGTEGLMIIFCLFLVYTILIILLTVYMPKFIKYLSSFHHRKTGSTHSRVRFVSKRHAVKYKNMKNQGK